MMKAIRTLRILASFSIVSVFTCANAQTLAIKGVTIGDTVDRMSAFGPCSMTLKESCLGTMLYGGSTSNFYVSHRGGRIVQMYVSYEHSRIPEVIEALKKEYGEPNATCVSQPCASWKKDGLDLDVSAAGKTGVTFLKRSEKNH
jgi:hypothetical protein